MSSGAEQEVRQEDGKPVLKNRYAVERELGRGGMSVVYLAHDRTLLNKPVVVKVLLEKQNQNEWVRKKFMQEMEALARIDHPGIISILDYGDLPNGTQYLVMQYVEGRTLRDAIPEGGMEMSRASNFIRQIGQALSAAHGKGVWHRDLKPENIMISTLAGGEEHVKLIDFGIAGIKDSVFAASKTNVAGSLTYMAPEQFAGQPSASSDLYAFAIVAYEMLTGRIPFPEDSLTHLASPDMAQVTPLRTYRPELPESVGTVMRRALSFQPEARHRSVNEFAAELTAALYPRPAAPPPAPAPLPAPQPSRRLFVGLLLAALLVGSAAFYAYSRLKPPPPPPAAPRIALNYSMILQRVRDGADFGAPIRAIGEMLVEHGHKLAFEFQPAHDGYLYVLNLADDKQSGRPTWVVLHPMATGSPRLAGSSVARVPAENWFRFDEAAGVELITVVWSDHPLPELDALIQKATIRGRTAVFEAEDLVKQLTFFLGKYRDQVQVSKNEAIKQTELRSAEGVLVYRIRLEHQ